MVAVGDGQVLESVQCHNHFDRKKNHRRQSDIQVVDGFLDSRRVAVVGVGDGWPPASVLFCEVGAIICVPGVDDTCKLRRYRYWASE